MAQKIKKNDVEDAFEHVQDFAGQAVDKTREVYEEIQSRLPENFREYLPWAGAGLAVGLIGYGLGRRGAHRREMLPEFSNSKIEFRGNQFNLEPIYRLARLWLLTRITR
jgi:hypothetical protein